MPASWCPCNPICRQVDRGVRAAHQSRVSLITCLLQYCYALQHCQHFSITHLRLGAAVLSRTWVTWPRFRAYGTDGEILWASSSSHTHTWVAGKLTTRFSKSSTLCLSTKFGRLTLDCLKHCLIFTVPRISAAYLVALCADTGDHVRKETTCASSHQGQGLENQFG